MYSRFFVKVLYDMGMVDFTEPFTRLLNQGQVINQGRAMSKSLGNGVDLGEQLAAHGVDAIRLTMIFASPPEDDIDWADMNPDAQVKFLGRVWRLAVEAGAADTGPGVGEGELRKVTHRTIDEFTRLVESSRLNVAVARLMELASATRRAIDSGPGAADPAVREAAETLVILLSIFAPYTAEECWELLGHQPSVALAGWPSPTRRCWSRTWSPAWSRSTARCATGWRFRPGSARTSCANWPWPPRARSGRWTAPASRRSSCARRAWSTSSLPDGAAARPRPPPSRPQGSRPLARSSHMGAPVIPA